MHARREQLFLFGATTLPVWAFLLCLIGPSLTRGGDCGELIAASYRLGIGHPTGYPVWCLLGRVFALLPWGEVAWRYNLFSSLCGALAAGFIALAAFRLVLPLAGLNQDATARPRESPARRPTGIAPRWLARWAALGAGFLFAGIHSVGTQFLIAEVYSGAALVGAALFYFALAWHQDDDVRDLFTLALLGGLALVVHLSCVFILPWLAIFALWKRGLGRAQLAGVLAFGLLGLTPLLYMPIRSAPFPPPASNNLDAYFYAPLDWGHPSTLGELKTHASGAQYRKLLFKTTTRVVNGQTVTTRRLKQPISELPGHLATLVLLTALSLLWATPLLVVGIVMLYRADKRVFWTLLLVAVGNIAVEINYDVTDQSNFFFPAYFAMALWLGAGIFVTLRFLAERGSLATKLGPLSLIATVGCQWFTFALTANYHGTTRVRDNSLEQARAMQKLAAQSGKPVSALIPSDDLLWGFWYMKYALGEAPDVETPWGNLVNTYGSEGRRVEYVALLRPRGPVCLSSWDAGVDARFPLVMLSPSGNICWASDRRLPVPAAPIPANRNPAQPTPGPNGLLAARFRRTPLWTRGKSEAYLFPATTAAFETDFRVPATWKPRAEDALCGRIEVLMAPDEQFEGKTPSPTQSALDEGKGAGGHKLVILQTRRLVLPAGARPGAVLRMATPLDVDVTARPGRYDVWTRLVPPQGSARPAWTHTDRVVLTQK